MLGAEEQARKTYVVYGDQASDDGNNADGIVLGF